MIYLANATGETDGSMHSMLLNVGSRLPIVLVSRPNEFKFNEQLLSLTDYVLVDCCEYGHDVEITDTHFFGKNTDEKFFGGEEWKKFDEWAANHPPKLYLKRELLKKDVSELVQPIEYAAWFEPPPLVDINDFKNRPLSVFYSWGYSSEKRRVLQGKIWTEAHKHGYMVCDNLYYLNKFMEHETNPKKWGAFHIPWFSRHPMPDLLQVQGLSKLSISMGGAGLKCFRSAESPLNSIMCLPNDDYSWTYEWEHGENCLRFSEENAVEEIANFLNRDDLYRIYVHGVANARQYYLPNYINHLEKLINGL
jgi:hypothetical protein